jgi:hypothetical protein
MAERIRNVTGRNVFAIVLIALGVLWTLDSLGFIESDQILRWWPVAVIAFGLSRLLGVGSRPNYGVGALFTIGGAWLLGNSLDLIRVSVFDLWPLVLVAIGASMILRSRPSQILSSATRQSTGEVHSFAFWSGLERQVVTDDFRGGDLSAIMGGVEVDLRSAKISSGRAVLDLLVMWGGIVVRVPEDWVVVNEMTVVMGGIEQKTKATLGASNQILALRGFALMGGIEIKN